MLEFDHLKFSDLVLTASLVVIVVTLSSFIFQSLHLTKQPLHSALKLLQINLSSWIFTLQLKTSFWLVFKLLLIIITLMVLNIRKNLALFYPCSLFIALISLFRHSVRDRFVRELLITRHELFQQLSLYSL